MHATYRQKFGFTDIVIRRKHTDARYDDGKDIWDGPTSQPQRSRVRHTVRHQCSARPDPPSCFSCPR
jgi:hypothetical protein